MGVSGMPVCLVDTNQTDAKNLLSPADQDDQPVSAMDPKFDRRSLFELAFEQVIDHLQVQASGKRNLDLTSSDFALVDRVVLSRGCV
jgi:hypothetical protein